ncbi:MAG: [protein-PII] uridylyltransferase [Akkermansiaceae bacterium]|nr:[protein-PII] uridylyltransferase [Akkermansiaceae bacterium]
MPDYAKALQQHAKDALRPAVDGVLSPSERIALFKQFLKVEEDRILKLHRQGAGGLEVAGNRSLMIDTVLTSMVATSPKAPRNLNELPYALVATGGYGRGLLNPGSDIDVLFLLPRASNKLPAAVQEQVQDVLYLLWDVGFKVGHACRSIVECVQQAKINGDNKTALMDARLITGDRKLFGDLRVRFAKDCINKGQAAFFEQRRDDLRTRHEKYSHTVFLQEPNVKESCGGMRDYQNVQWVAHVKEGSPDLGELVEKRILTNGAYREMQEAYDFLHRVRNELHYYSGKATDQLTLFLQGVVATAFNYPQRNILRSTEAFMRDYYRHTRHIYQHSTSLMEAFQIEQETKAESAIHSFLTFRRKSREEFDGFVARSGRLFPAGQDIFREDPQRLMRLFQHCQVRNLKLSPQLRRLIAQHWEDIDRPFRYSKANREVFQAILERKGEVGRTLRLMHRIGFLGRYLPEFGALDCLVQHEFFHRYTADEHTLRCIDQLDKLVHDDSPRHGLYRRLFRAVQDPYGFYLAVILHDTGRAENVREHTDGSAILAARLCNRLQIQGARRRLIMFLVDNHLTFWRTATSRNLDDPEVIAEFAAIVKTPANLDALLLFTYIDSNGTAPDAWNGWKESLMLQLHTATHAFLDSGREQYEKKLNADRLALRKEVTGLMREDYHADVRKHFDRMPAAAFHFRQAAHIVTQVRTVRHFLQRESENKDGIAFNVKWIDHPDRGNTEMVIATRDRPLLLEKICCALASEQINILSADFFTRSDGVVVNIFRICTTNFEPVSSAETRKRFLQTFDKILHAEKFEPEKYLKRRANFLKARNDHDIPVPVRAYVSNELHPTCTTVEIQALDRIGLLHDLFHTINSHDLETVHARISTEKGVAMDTLYITEANNGKVSDPALLKQLEQEFTELIGRREQPE